MSVTIYHNPRCSKSRQALALLQEKGEDITVIEYLKSGLSRKEIDTMLVSSGLSVREHVRTGEKIYKELGLKDAQDGRLIEALIEHPILLERPVVVKNGKVVIARPPEKAYDVL